LGLDWLSERLSKWAYRFENIDIFQPAFNLMACSG